MALHTTSRVLCFVFLAAICITQIRARSVEKRDSPRATCTFDNSTNGAPIGRDHTCDYGCAEECGVGTFGLIFDQFTGATYSNRTIACDPADCIGSQTKVASLPYGVIGTVSPAFTAATEIFELDDLKYACLAKLKGDVKTRVAKLDALFPQLKNAGSDVRKAMRTITSLPVRCNATVTAMDICAQRDPSVCQYVPNSVTQVGTVPLPSGMVIKPVDGIGLPAQPLTTCLFDFIACAESVNITIAKVPSKLEKHGLCAEDVNLVIDDFDWISY